LIARQEHLPDFDSPPLDEVVIGVQFTPPQHYASVFAKDVWELFKDEYPHVQEQPPLYPSFETFGGLNPQPDLKLQFDPALLHSRLWFISHKQNHLIQFQSDRFLLNWRKRPINNEYPRFESIAQSFENYLNTLQVLFVDSFKSQLDINQAEVSYINTIPVEKFSLVGKWFSFFAPQDIELETTNLSFTEVIKGAEGKPYARMIYELQSAVTIDGKEKAFKLSLTFRGKPAGKTISEAMTFAYTGREKITTRFKELTTNYAHSHWRIRK
jgi:uncharacterized protein (TIGR04255 family)